LSYSFGFSDYSLFFISGFLDSTFLPDNIGGQPALNRYVFFKLAHNVLGLCEEAELEAQMFVLAQMFIRIPNVQFSTEPAILPNCC